jgi:hypothetical protein
MGEPELGGVGGQGVHLLLGNGIFYGFVLVAGGCIVVRHAVDLLRPEAFDTTLAKAVESLGAGYLMAVQTVDVQLLGTSVQFLYHVRIPDFVK